VIVWIPRVEAGTVNNFQRGEFIVTFALMAGAWVVTNFYDDTHLRMTAPAAHR